MGWRSSTRGFKSIISVWEWRVSITVSRVMPTGSGVRVVKTVRFDIVKYLWQCRKKLREDERLMMDDREMLRNLKASGICHEVKEGSLI